MSDYRIASRVSRILNLFLVSLLLILLRVWFLSVVQHDERFLESRKPQRRTLIEPVERATIRDRFNIPLAINQIQYNAAVCYADIRQVPSIQWEKDEKGKPRKFYLRRHYIEELSSLLAKELDLDPQGVEDLIHGKASLFPHTPFVLKEDISESLYAKLKLLEKDWAGLQTQKVSRRIYPQGRVACDVIGYLGAISQNEYLKIAQETQLLKTYLSEREEGKLVFLPKGYDSPIEVRRRLKELEERAYTINALVGKSGVEAAFDQTLRGVYGKRTLEVDQKGNCLRELPGGRPAVSGERLILSLSAELQQTAEELLAEYEYFQDKRDQALGGRHHPWIRGSSIVAMHPKTGEVLALASYPRFDPNDFILAQHPAHKNEKRSAVRRWVESEAHIAEIWDGKTPLSRELFDPKKRCFYEESHILTWDEFLQRILGPKSSELQLLKAVHSVNEALQILEEGTAPPLVLDLLQLVVRPRDLPVELRESIGSLSLQQWRLYNQTACKQRALLQSEIRSLYHRLDFKEWRAQRFKEFLKIKREEEKKLRRYARPYTDYLEMEEERQFKQFWQTHRLLFIHCFLTGSCPTASPLAPYLDKIVGLHSSQTDPAFASLESFLTPLPLSTQLHLIKAWRSFDELNSPLRSRYPLLRQHEGSQLERHLAASFYPLGGFGYGRSQAFRQATPQGSVFKLIPVYALLRQRLDEMKEEVHSFGNWSPFTLNDQSRSGNMTLFGHFENGEPIPRFYKGGRLPRSSHSMGRIDLLGAIECSSNIYFSILAGDLLHDPAQLNQHAKEFGMGQKTGIELPGEFKGVLPEDISHNKTGIYSYAIGQHSLVVTPLQTAAMFSAIANKGALLKPQIIKLSAGKQRAREEQHLFFQTEFPYQESLERVGLHFPVFTQAVAGKEQGYIACREPEVRSTLPMPPAIHDYLVEGMRLVTNGARGSARPSGIQAAYHDPLSIQALRSLQTRLIGKTGTAEILFKQTIDPETPAQMEKHVWFAGISYEDATLQEPELVVVAYLRFGNSGKEGAPLVARIVERWKEIQASHAAD